MEIIHFEDPGEFQGQVLDTLAQHEAENNLILGILANLIEGEYRDYQPYMTAVQEAGKIQVVSLCTPPHPTLISYSNPPPEKEVVRAMLADMQEVLQEDFRGFHGNKAFVSCLGSEWEKQTGKQAVQTMSMQIYKLEEVQPVSGVPGVMRRVEKEDRPLLEEWFAGFHREALKEEPDPKRVLRQVRHYLSAAPQIRGLMLWEVAGQPVSMAGYAGPTPNGIRIGAVYTPPECRNQGYASALTAQLSQHLLKEGYRFCFLFADLLNPTSNHIYQRIGYQPVCDSDRYMVE